VIGAGVVALFILIAGWRRFRYGGEVIEGSGVVDKVPGGTLERRLKNLARSG